MISDTEIAKQFKKHRKISDAKLGKQRRNTKKCQSFYDGDMMSYEDHIDFAGQRGKKKKAMVKFNKVQPYVNAVNGFMLQNRNRQKYEARMEDNQVQELFTQYANSIATYVRDNAFAEQVETQQDGDMLVCGYGATETALSYGEGFASHEANGEIIKGRLDPLSVSWDPMARATNLRDARWVYYTKEYDLDMAMTLFDDSEEEDFEAVDENSTESHDFKHLPRGGRYDKISENNYDVADAEENTVKVHFYQWYNIEPYFRAPNPLYNTTDQNSAMAIDAFLQMVSEEHDEDDFDPRGEVLIFNESMKSELQEYFGDLMPEIFRFRRKVYYTAVLSGEKVFTSYKNVSQQGYTIQFKTGNYNASRGIWTGMVNSMMEPVLYYNKALSELMYTIAANSKGGVFYEESAVDDIKEFEANYAKTDAAIKVADGALSGGKIQEKKSPHVPTGLDQIIGNSDKAITDVNGFDMTFMGSREFAQDTAKFQRQRIKQVMSLLAGYFDAATMYQKSDARIMLDLIRVYAANNEDMALRVLGEDGQAMFLRLSPKQLSAEFDVTIQEAPLSAQDKQDQADLLIGMAERVAMIRPDAAMALYLAAVELLPLDYSIKESIKQALAPKDGEEIDPAQVQQLQKMVQQYQSEENQLRMADMQANIALDQAKAEQTMASAAKARADIVKTLEQSEQVSIENDLAKRAKSAPIESTQVDINI